MSGAGRNEVCARCARHSCVVAMWGGVWGQGGSRVHTPQAQAAVSLPRALDLWSLGSMLAALDDLAAPSPHHQPPMAVPLLHYFLQRVPSAPCYAPLRPLPATINRWLPPCLATTCPAMPRCAPSPPLSTNGRLCPSHTTACSHGYHGHCTQLLLNLQQLKTALWTWGLHAHERCTWQHEASSCVPPWARRIGTHKRFLCGHDVGHAFHFQHAQWRLRTTTFLLTAAAYSLLCASW